MHKIASLYKEKKKKIKFHKHTISDNRAQIAKLFKIFQEELVSSTRTVGMYRSAAFTTVVHVHGEVANYSGPSLISVPMLTITEYPDKQVTFYVIIIIGSRTSIQISEREFPEGTQCSTGKGSL